MAKQTDTPFGAREPEPDPNQPEKPMPAPGTLAAALVDEDTGEYRSDRTIDGGAFIVGKEVRNANGEVVEGLAIKNGAIVVKSGYHVKDGKLHKGSAPKE
jgi:hypothetical protein